VTPWSRSSSRAIWNPLGIPPKPAGGISPRQNDSAAPIGRPRHRKAPLGLAPRSPRKSRLPFRSRRRHRRPAKRIKRQRLSRRKSSRKENRLRNRMWPWDGVPLPLGQVPGIGVDGAATTRTALPGGQTIPRGSANHGRSGPHVGTRHRRPKRKLPLPLNARRGRLSKIPQKYRRRAFAGGMAIPGWLRVYRSSK